MLSILPKIHKKFYIYLMRGLSKIYISIFLDGRVKNGFGCEFNGVPLFNICGNGEIFIGDRVKINSNKIFNPIGRDFRTTFFVGESGKIFIGDGTGISSAAIVAFSEVIIGANVKIGGGVCIYDTDFHSVRSTDRNIPEIDRRNSKSEKILIGDNVFVGAHSLILKGVSIGKNSIIGAGSVVTRDVPSGEIWAGNPAKFIKNAE